MQVRGDQQEVVHQSYQTPRGKGEIAQQLEKRHEWLKKKKDCLLLLQMCYHIQICCGLLKDEVFCCTHPFS